MAPEKRTSVTIATESPRPSPTMAAATPSISRMPGRHAVFVADHDDVARLGLAGGICRAAMLLFRRDTKRS